MCKCAIDLSVHFKCAHRILNLYLKETLTKIVILVVKNISIQRLLIPVLRQKQFGPKIRLHSERNGHP